MVGGRARHLDSVGMCRTSPHARTASPHPRTGTCRPRTGVPRLEVMAPAGAPPAAAGMQPWLGAFASAQAPSHSRPPGCVGENPFAVQLLLELPLLATLCRC